MESPVNLVPQEISESVTIQDVQEPRSRSLSKGILLVLLFLAALNCATNFDTVMNFDGQQDFSIFYTGARIIWSGHAAQLYDLATQAHYQTPHYQIRPLPFDHPAYELLMFLPLIPLPFNMAAVAWGIIGLALSWLIAQILARQLPYFPRPGPLWIFAMCAATFPLLWTLAQGQDSIVLLALFAFVYSNLKSRRDVIAGAALAAGLFKFTLILPFVIPFLLFRRWKFLAGFAAGGFVVTSISVAMTGIEGARQYVRLLLELIAHPGLGYIHTQGMPNLRGFLTDVLLDNGLSHATFSIVLGVCTLLLLLVPLLTFRDGEERSERFDMWFGLNLTVATLASPHVLWHDLTILLLPALLATNFLLKSAERGISWRAIVWALAYALALPEYFVFYPGYYFPIWCVLAYWFLRKIMTFDHAALNTKAAPVAISPA